MSTKRFLTFLILAVFMVVTALTVQVSMASGTPINDTDSATRSYSAWAKAAEANSQFLNSATQSYIAWAKAVEMKGSMLDSATRSYMAWAKAVEDNGAKYSTIPLRTSPDLNSATRSYIAWAKAVATGPDLEHDLTIDSATRSYIAWAKSLQSEH